MSYYKGRLRVTDLDALPAQPPDPRPLHCPTCSAVITGGWCPDCGLDWCDGCADQLRVANPHVYGTSTDLEELLVDIADQYTHHGHDPKVQARYKTLHEYWMKTR